MEREREKERLYKAKISKTIKQNTATDGQFCFNISALILPLSVRIKGKLHKLSLLLTAHCTTLRDTFLKQMLIGQLW